MKLPCEFIGEKYLATIRKRLAFKLKEKGYSQKQIGDILSISQPVVSGYLKNELGEPSDVIEEVATEVSNEILDYVLSNKIDKAMRTVCIRCKALRNQGPICNLHKEFVPSLKNITLCTACLESSYVSGYGEERFLFLEKFEKEVNTLINRREFAFLIPEIGAQIAIAYPNAEYTEDIISFPGRIIRVKNRAVMVSKPEYGASITVPKILLWARKNVSENIIGVIACKNIDFLERWVQSRGKKIVRTRELDRRMDETLSNLSCEENISDLRLIRVSGVVGLEAISYLFFEDLLEVHDLLDNFGVS